MQHQPFVPPGARLPEFTVRAVLLGVVQAVVLGAANAYLGMKAGQTIAATFPAAVVSMLVLKAFRGSILEENLSRTAASVGEALVAGAIFTIPAFVIAGVWEDFNYWESSFLMLVGGTLGILFVIFLRRTLCEDPTLPFPEAVAAAEIHKAGQKGATGAGYLFGAMGFAGVVELLKNPAGLHAIQDSVGGFLQFASSKITWLRRGQPFGEPGTYAGGMHFETPFASPAFLSVGFIIGPKLAALNFSGGVLAWMILVPLIMFLSGEGSALMNLASDPSLAGEGLSDRLGVVADQAWRGVVRPIAVGAMLVSAGWTLFRMRGPLIEGIARVARDIRKGPGPAEEAPSRVETDLSMKWVVLSIFLLIIPMTILFAWFTGGIGSALTAAVAMTITGFVFSAVAGYLVGVIGSSSSPVSGLALSALILSAVLLVGVGVHGPGGVMAVLAVATVVCCAASIGGDIIQDLKVGYILGGTPWAMQLAEIIAVVLASFVLVIPISELHKADILQGGMGIGGDNLPAPQAGLMAMLAKGIVEGGMAWPLVFMGVAFAIGLILLGCPSPMIVAVGMYLDFATVSAIFAGGVLRWVLDWIMERRRLAAPEIDFRINVGTLLASGMIAGEALIGVTLAILINQGIELPHFAGSGAAGLLVFAAIGWILIGLPLRVRRPSAPSTSGA